MNKVKVLFLCTGNSCRSQMAEGWCRHLKSESIEAFSAGTNTLGVNKRAIKAMKESGVDISHHKSKSVNQISEKFFDYVFTVCGNANENCPYFPGKATIHHVGFDDPPKKASGLTDEEEIQNEYRKVRDEIKTFIEKIEVYF
ncbi:MAG: arsenate reductase [Halobacteriovoraceae bacterium]|nr:arsenate reductase [Halobacteriovoraceae bacterium]